MADVVDLAARRPAKPSGSEEIAKILTELLVRVQNGEVAGIAIAFQQLDPKGRAVVGTVVEFAPVCQPVTLLGAVKILEQRLTEGILA